MAMMTSVATPKGTVPMAEVLCGVHRVTAMVAFKCGWVGDHLRLEAGLDDSLKDRRCGKADHQGGPLGVESCPDH